MKIRSFISRLQERNAYLEEFPSDTEGQETAPLPADKIMDIIYHSMPTKWKKKMVEYGFNYVDSTIKKKTDFFEARVENLEFKKDKKNLKHLPRKVSRKPISKNPPKLAVKEKKYYILHGKCNYSTDNCKIFVRWSISPNKKVKNFRNYGKSNKELNALIEKKFQKFVKN